VPIFVDRTGRRRRLLVTGGVIGALLLTGAVGAMLLAVTGASGRTLPGLPATTPRPHVTPASARPQPDPATSATAGTASTAGTPHTSPTGTPAPSLAPSPTADPTGTATPAPGSTHRHTPTPPGQSKS
jgi:hypothetical protein